jgi:hypothetical protein
MKAQRTLRMCATGPSIEDYSRQVWQAAKVARNDMTLARLSGAKPRSKLAATIEHSRRLQARFPKLS